MVLQLCLLKEMHLVDHISLFHPKFKWKLHLDKKIITDEYSGRILVDPKLAEEEMDKMKSIFS
jgi:hypothetical protein